MEEIRELARIDPVQGVQYEDAKWILEVIDRYRMADSCMVTPMVPKKMDILKSLMGGNDIFNAFVEYLEDIVNSIDRYPVHDSVVEIEDLDRANESSERSIGGQQQLRVSIMLRCYANLHQMSGHVQQIMETMMRNPHAFEDKSIVVPKKVLLNMYLLKRGSSAVTQEKEKDFPGLEDTCLRLEEMFEYYVYQVVPIINRYNFTPVQIASAKHLVVELHGVRHCGFVVAVQRMCAFGNCLDTDAESRSKVENIGDFVMESVKHARIVVAAMDGVL